MEQIPSNHGLMELMDSRVLSLTLLLASAVFAQQPSGAISGRAINQATGAPVRNAVVNLTLLGGDEMLATSPTDGSGSFRFTSLPAGRYRLAVFREGYDEKYYGARKPNQPGQIIALTDGEARSYIIHMAPLCAISGVVLDEEGDPLINAQVQAFQPDYERYRSHVVAGAATMTNDRGEYRMFGVRPGRYYVMASERNRNALRTQPEAVTGQAGADAGYGVQFFPGTGKLSAATLLNLTAGNEINGVDFHLPAIHRVHVRGKIDGPMDQLTNPGVQFSVIPQDVPETNNFQMGGGLQVPGYTFEQANLVPGTYLFLASLTSGDKHYRGWQKVEVGNADIDGLTIALAPGAEVNGWVEVEGPGAEQYKHFQLNLTPGDYLNPDAVPVAETDKTMHFHFPSVVPGIWDIGVNPIPKGGYLKAMYLGDQDVLTEDMVIGTDTKAPLKIVMSTQAPLVEGDVEVVGKNQPIVLLAPEGKFRDVMSFYRVVLADDKGHFKIGNQLTPGAYKLYAFEEMEFNAYQNPEFLKPFESLGAPVQLAEGQTSRVKLTLIPAGGRPR